MSDHYAESAAVFADSARAAVAFLRAIRDQRHDDPAVITEGVNPYSLAVQITNVACHNYGITDEFLDQELKLLNRADVNGELELFARENGIVLNPGKKQPEVTTPFHPDIIGETPAGLAVGTIKECRTCKDDKACCMGCIFLRGVPFPGVPVMQRS